MARGRFFPDEDETTELVIADGQNVAIDVHPGCKVTACRQLEPDALPFKPRFIDVPDPDWEIWNLLVGAVPQLHGYFDNGRVGVPAELFGPLTTLPPLRIDTVAPGLVVTIAAVNKAAVVRKLRARLIGHEVIPRGHPAHAPTTALLETVLKSGKS